MFEGLESLRSNSDYLEKNDQLSRNLAKLELEKRQLKGRVREESQSKTNLQERIKEFEETHGRLTGEREATHKKVAAELEETNKELASVRETARRSLTEKATVEAKLSLINQDMDGKSFAKGK